MSRRFNNMVDDVNLLDADIIDYHVTIPLMDIPENKATELFVLEGRMRNDGITFDTGFGKDGREWFLDWSAKGASPQVIMNKLRDTEIKFFVEMKVRERDE